MRGGRSFPPVRFQLFFEDQHRAGFLKLVMPRPFREKVSTVFHCVNEVHLGLPKSAWILGKSHVHADGTLWDLASEEWHHTDTHWAIHNCPESMSLPLYGKLGKQ